MVEPVGQNPPVTLVTPAAGERTATMAPTCSAAKPGSTANTVASRGMLLDMRRSKRWTPMGVDTNGGGRQHTVSGAASTPADLSGSVPSAAAEARLPRG